MVPERQVAGDDAGFAIAVDLGVFDVDVIDTVGEVARKDGGVHPLPDEVAGIEIEAELRPVVERFQGALGRVEVEGDLRGVDLQGEANAMLAEFVHDGIPTLGEEPIPVGDHLRFGRGERVDQVPDRRAGKPVDDLHAEVLGGLGTGHHLPDAPLTDLLRLIGQLVGGKAVAAGIVRVQHQLALQMHGDGPHVESMLRQDGPLPGAVGRIGGLLDIEVVTPTGQLEAFVAPAGGLLGQRGQWGVGPLAGKESHGSSHRHTSGACGFTTLR